MRLIFAALILSAAPALAEIPKVGTDIPPVASLTAQVMGDLGKPTLLLEKGASAHDFQLRPSQAAALADADLVIWIGPEMTPWLDRALKGTGTGGNVLGLLAAERTYRKEFEGKGEHDDGDHAAADEADGHTHDGIDPHAWLNPDNAAIWLGLIAEALSQEDPDNSATYLANAEAARDTLASTTAEVTAILAPHSTARFVVFHDAYGYFSGFFGLTGIEAIAAGDATTPGAERLAELKAEITAEDIICVFPEAGHDVSLAELMTEGTGARLGRALDPEGIDLDVGVETYGAILTGLASAIDDCLSGR